MARREPASRPQQAIHATSSKLHRLARTEARGNQVVVLSTQSAGRGGTRWSSPQVEVWTVKEGRACAYWQFQGDQQAEDEFWALPV
jgi:hypothetical protein